MINFRYHIVSLTAVFLSLVIGIAMGTTVVSKATVDGLRTNLNRVEARSTSVQAANADLRAKLRDADKMDESLEDQMLTPTVREALTDVPVLVIASKGIDRNALDQVLKALTASGADLDGTLLVNERLLLTGENSDRLAEALGVDPSWRRSWPVVQRCRAWEPPSRPRPPRRRQPRCPKKPPRRTSQQCPVSKTPTSRRPPRRPCHRLQKSLS